MTEEMITAIEAALSKGFRVELTKEKDGAVRVRTVTRKELKIKA